MKVYIQAILLTILKDKEEWLLKYPHQLPMKQYPEEKFLFIDKNGFVLESVEDFHEAHAKGTFPISIYRTLKTKNRKWFEP